MWAYRISVRALLVLFCTASVAVGAEKGELMSYQRLQQTSSQTHTEAAFLVCLQAFQGPWLVMKAQ